MFTMQLLKTTLLTPPLMSIAKTALQSFQAQVACMLFKTLIFIWKLKLFHWPQIPCLVLFGVAALLCSFLRKGMSQLSLNTHSLARQFFLSLNENDVLKWPFISQLENHTGVFPKDLLQCSVEREVLNVFHIWSESRKGTYPSVEI